jgi:DNA-directed RNA polymerase specialized sigma24 family protein
VCLENCLRDFKKNAYGVFGMSTMENPKERWELLVNNYLSDLSPVFNRFIRQNNLGSISADDIKHDVFLNFHMKITKETLIFDEEKQIFYTIKNDLCQEIRSLKAYLKSCGIYAIFKYTKKEKPSELVRYIDEINSSNNFSSLDYIDIIEIKEVMYQELTGVDCRILNLSFFENNSAHDISKALWKEGYGSYSPDNVRQRKRRALKRLQEILQTRY